MLLSALPARADEPLTFRSAGSDFHQKLLADYLLQTQGAEGPFLTAQGDLNGDGITEHFLKSEKTSPVADVYLLGVKHREVTLLGKIPARKIEITDKKQWGVRRLVVYNDPGNDFRSQIWVWNPWDFQFQEEK
jgi:hypothetical protein